MSIRELIRDCVDGGELVQLRPFLPSMPINRDLFVTPRVMNYLNRSPTSRRDVVKKAMDTRAALDRFVAGARIAVAMDPFDKRASAELARNDPTGSGVWVFRIRDPKPHIRVFGAFSEKDVFVAFDYYNREGLDFDAAVRNVKSEWVELFGAHSPVVGDNVDEYLSDKYYLV